MQTVAPVEESADNRGKRRRPRQRFSCVPCQRRKSKCDKQEPCESCIKRETVSECKWEEPILDPATIAEDLAAELQSVRRRLARVETRMQDYERNLAVKQETATFSPTQSMSQLHHHLPPAPSRAEATVPGVPGNHAEVEVALVLESLATSNNMIAPSSFGKELSDVPQVRLGHEHSPLGPNAAESQRRELVPGSPILPAGSNRYPTIRRQLPSQNPSKRNRTLVSAPMDYVPSVELTNALVSVWFSDLAWIHNIMHSPTFTAQCTELYALQTAENPVEIDPGWMAVYYLVLAWSISYRLPKLREAVISTQQAREMANDWHSAALQSLAASEWPVRPRIWPIQAMVLAMYFRFGLVATQRSELITVYTWLSPAIRLAQLLGLHRLGQDPNVMPADDPAFPPGRSAIKRETAKRIWSYLLTSDWMTCTHNGFAQIPRDSFDTDRPLLVLDEDMLPDTQIIQERPLSHLTDTTFARVQRVLANFQVTAYRYLTERDKTYAIVLELESILQNELDHLELINVFPTPRLQPYLVALAKSTLNNRILRLHRPFFLAGWTVLQFAHSTSSCLRCATNIATCLETLATTPIEGLWYLRTHAMGAGLILFMDLYREMQNGLNGAQLARKHSALLTIRGYFFRTSGGPASTSSPHLIYDKLLGALFPHGSHGPPINPHDLPPLSELLHSVAATTGSTFSPQNSRTATVPNGSMRHTAGTIDSSRALKKSTASGGSSSMLLDIPAPSPVSSSHGHHDSPVHQHQPRLSLSVPASVTTPIYGITEQAPLDSMAGPSATLPPPPGIFDELDASWAAMWDPANGPPPLHDPQGRRRGSSDDPRRRGPSGPATGELTDWGWILSVGGNTHEPPHPHHPHYPHPHGSPPHPSQNDVKPADMH